MTKLSRTLIACTAALALAAPGIAMAQDAASAPQTWQEATDYTGQQTTLGQDPMIFPPWDDAPTTNARNFTVPEVNNLPDLHGDIVDPQLVVYFAGNQYMMVQELMEGFKKAHPEYQRIFYVTLPPGILVQALEQHNGSFAIGNLTISTKPDILTRGKGAMERSQKAKGLFSRMEDYAGNKLALMVARGNPKDITSLGDLAKPNVRVSMPNPHWEGIAKLIEKAYVEAGGQDLDTAIMQTKTASGMTYLTHIHHRETPMRIMAGLSDAGPVWVTEGLYQSKRHSDKISMVPLPDDQNEHAIYTAGMLKGAAHPKAAAAFLDYITSPAGQAIITKYGFEPKPAK